ncbi:MAG: VWA domain-containing protein [bacterium]|nr:VWA domain-containing protein [bacterium]
MTATILWTILALVIIYLGIGLGIYAAGTRKRKEGAKSIIRNASQCLVFKEENINVSLQASTLEMPQKKEEKEPWNVVLVLDKSGSMGAGSALDHAKEAAKNLIAATPGYFSYGVVEFQETARICSRLTGDRPKLQAAIDKIVIAGGTAIHEGLRLAADLVADEAAAEKKNAVILLSDGGSSESLAIKQAEILKEHDVTVYTVGLGCCNRELMLAIAGSDERFFYAEKPDQLKDFFFTIGRNIRKNSARDVTITEYPANTTQPLRITGWGKIKPMDTALFDKDKPYMKWYMPGLEEEYTRVDYQVKSRCCGWYPVAGDKAEVSMKNNENNEFTYTSDKGPHILVIPRFFLWQFFWIFLNPLYWIIKHRVLKLNKCAQQKVVFEKPAYKIQKTALPAPAEILPSLETVYSLEMNPTVVIGVGYGGIHALTHLKRLIWEHDDDERVRDKLVLVGLDSVKPYFAEAIRSGTVALEESERLNIHVPTARYIVEEARKDETEREHVWLDAEGMSAEGIDYDTGSGTFGSRRAGRLIYLQNRQRIRELKPLIKKLYDAYPEEPLNICITGTTSGGTASGMMPDLCYSIKQILKELAIPQKSISLFLVDAEPDKDATDRQVKEQECENNRQALTRELARFFAARDTAFSALPGEEKIDQWFDHVFYVDKKESTGNITGLYPQTAAVLYQWVTEKGFRDFVMRSNRYSADGLLVHRVEAYVGFFYKRLLEDYFSLRLMLTVIGNLVLGLGENPGKFTYEKVELKQLPVEEALDLLLNKEEWKAGRPFLLSQTGLMKKPDGNTLSGFLAMGGQVGIDADTTAGEINEYIQNENNAFGNLVFAWLSLLLHSAEEQAHEPFKEKKLPLACKAVTRLKETITAIKETAESISAKESLLNRKQCSVISRICAAFLESLERWEAIFINWYEILGEGPGEVVGIARMLNNRLNAVEKAIETSEQSTTPHFQFPGELKEKFYQKYFQGLEKEIQAQVRWQLEAPEEIKLSVATHKSVGEYRSKAEAAGIGEIADHLLDLPGYFAARMHEWHHATINELFRMSRESGHDVVRSSMTPHLEKAAEHDVLFLNKPSYEELQEGVPTGIRNETLETGSPFIHGFFKYRLNEALFRKDTGLAFDSLPPFIFAEEWNCYNALTVYRETTRKEADTPAFGVVALCRDMKKFLGAVKIGIIDSRIESIQSGAQMVLRFDGLLEIPQSSNSETDVLKLIREVAESNENAINQALHQGFNQALEIEPSLLENLVNQSKVPISRPLKQQLYQLIRGSIVYYKHL